LATDGLNRLFSNENPIVTFSRRAGVSVLEKMPTVKKFFMQHARGSTGKLPKLLRGRPL